MSSHLAKPCACGGVVRLGARTITAAVAGHRATRQHSIWSARLDRAPAVQVATLRIRRAPAAGDLDPARSVRGALDRLDELDALLAVLRPGDAA